jgi:hypothetical protein
MAKRNSPRDVQGLADLSRLTEIVVDKRIAKSRNESVEE